MAGALLVGGVGLAACGGGSSGSDSASSGGGGGDATSSAPSYTMPDVTQPEGKPTGTIRLVNVFLRDGKGFGPLDVYDTANPTEDTKPLISDLGYGEVSDYVRPRSPYSDSGNLYIFPAGSIERQADGIGGQAVSNAGWESGEQATVVIGTTDGMSDPKVTNPLYSEISESDDSATWKAIPGKGAILANDSGVGLDHSAASVTLVVDGKCPMRTDPENSPGQGQGLDSLANANAVTYEVEPGSHDLGLLATDPDTSPTTCTAADAIADTTVDVGSGQRVEIFVFGTSPTDLKIVAAKVRS